MKKLLLFLLTIVLFIGCKEEPKIDATYVISKFYENADKINTLEYRIQRIDTFAKAGAVWNNTGVALIEKDENDKIFGFSFYGKRDDVPNEFIYDAGNAFEISKEHKNYKVGPGYSGFLGSPGGQMVHRNLFALDTIYQDISLKETENSYLLYYEFENDTVYQVTDRIKVVQLDKANFFPIQIKQTLKQLGNKSVSIANFSDIKINNTVLRSIKDLKQAINGYTVLKPKKTEANKLLSKKLPAIELPDLFDPEKIVQVTNENITLIDFWEVWCGPCIASFPMVENLKNKFSSELNVVGIVTEDSQKARELIEKNGTTFQILIGSSALKNSFGVTSWPRYFLIDAEGTVRKEYHGFSSQIELDIKELLLE